MLYFYIIKTYTCRLLQLRCRTKSQNLNVSRPALQLSPATSEWPIYQRFYCIYINVHNFSISFVTALYNEWILVLDHRHNDYYKVGIEFHCPFGIHSLSVWLSKISNTFTVTTRSPRDFAESRRPWATYQIRKIAGCACAGNARNVSPATAGYRSRHASRNVRDARAVIVPWCMPGWPTSGFHWSQWRGKRSRHSRCMRNPQIYLSGKRPMFECRLTLQMWHQCRSSASYIKGAEA